MLQLVFATCNTKTIDGENEIAFGLNNGLPWGHIPQDMKNFKARTLSSVMIMGAKTFESFNAPLPGRRSVVVCNLDRPLPKTKNGTKATEVLSMEEFKRFLDGESIVTSQKTKEYPWDTVVGRERCDVSIIGGKSLIQQAVNRVDQIVHTNIIKAHRVNSDVQMDESLLMNIRSKYKIESHWYQCDEVTQLIETVYKNKA